MANTTNYSQPIGDYLVTNDGIPSLPTGQSLQRSLSALLQNAATATGNGIVGASDGYNGCQMVELVNTGSAGATIVLEGSYDQVNWYAVGYQQVDATATPTRAASALAVAATSQHVYQVLDMYPYLRARISALTAGASINARLYAVPV